MTSGERIKAERERRGWSQRELARRAGIAQGGLSKLENGDRLHGGNIETLQKIAGALDFTVDALLNGTPQDDLSQPPVEVFQAAGYSASLIARLVANWPERSAAWRLEKVTQARRRVDEMRDLEQAIL